MSIRSSFLSFALFFMSFAHADFEIDRHNFTICNDTSINVNVALQLHVESSRTMDVHVKGWWVVPAHQCLPMGLIDSLVGIYTYGIDGNTTYVFKPSAEALSEYDDDSVKFCVKPYRFDFKGLDVGRCQESETRIFHTYVINDRTEVYHINGHR